MHGFAEEVHHCCNVPSHLCFGAMWKGDAVSIYIYSLDFLLPGPTCRRMNYYFVFFSVFGACIYRFNDTYGAGWCSLCGALRCFYAEPSLIQSAASTAAQRDEDGCESTPPPPTPPPPPPTPSHPHTPTQQNNLNITGKKWSSRSSISSLLAVI